MVAPNGARRTKVDHPALPVTLDEIVNCAKECYAAGADGLHAHIRDNSGAHLLDADEYMRLISRVHQAVPDMAIQITTEAAGIYDPEVQMRVALASGADMVSASVKEISRAGLSQARTFYREMQEKGIAVQHILYGVEDCHLLQATIDEASLVDPSLQLIFVLGSYGGDRDAKPDDLDVFLAWLKERGISPDWAVCAFGSAEVACLKNAVAHGGKCRVGFENSFVLSDGTVALDNAQKVTDLLVSLGPKSD
jgi:uncharacterized protein (DUF849 family)